VVSIQAAVESRYLRKETERAIFELNLGINTATSTQKEKQVKRRQNLKLNPSTQYHKNKNRNSIQLSSCNFVSKPNQHYFGGISRSIDRQYVHHFSSSLRSYRQSNAREL
jgi:hypothetical protein